MQLSVVQRYIWLNQSMVFVYVMLISKDVMTANGILFDTYNATRRMFNS